MTDETEDTPEFAASVTNPSEPETPETPETLETPPELSRQPGPARVLLLGPGELGRELVFAFQQLGAEVIAVDGHAEAPAQRVADESWVVELTDPDTLTAAVERIRPDYVVAATEAVAADALAAAERGHAEVVPSARSARLTLDREGLRRLAADELGLPTAPFWFAGSVDELAAIADHAGFPLVVKPLVARPGEGQSVLLRAGDIEPAWQRAISAGGRFTHRRVLAETVVEIDYEVTLLTVRTADPGGVHFCSPIGHRQVAGVLESWQPQQMSEIALDAAKSIAARIIGALGGRGVFGVELLVRGDEVYFSDVTAVPHDSALVTLRSQRLSHFELHARATLGLPLDTIMISPGAAEVIYGEAAGDRDNLVEVLTSALGVTEADVRVFGTSVGAPSAARRKLGLALATGADVATARDRVRLAGTALRGLWQS